MIRAFGRSVSAAAVVLVVVATACSDVQNPQSPKLEAWGTPPPQTGELRGIGSIGSAPDEQFFGFDVKSQQMRITGLFLGAEPFTSTPATLITGPTEPGTGFTAFRSSSSFCSDPSHGAEFDAVGHLVEPNLNVYVVYTIKGCDNGPPGSGVDTWSVDIPSRSYHKDGAVAGDIQKL
jgi:hypothetical protein